MACVSARVICAGPDGDWPDSPRVHTRDTHSEFAGHFRAAALSELLRVLCAATGSAEFSSEQSPVLFDETDSGLRTLRRNYLCDTSLAESRPDAGNFYCGICDFLAVFARTKYLAAGRVAHGFGNSNRVGVTDCVASRAARWPRLLYVSVGSSYFWGFSILRYRFNTS